MSTEPSRALGVRALLLAGLCVLCGCGRDWRTDLWYQVAAQARDRPRPEPAGSVSLEARPHLDDRDDAQDWRSPFPSDAAAVERGRATFLERCSPCHGRSGHGGGPVTRYFPPAPDLAYSSVRARSDGFIYATVAIGGRAMPRVSEGLDERDRWDLVHFIRALQADTPLDVAASAQPAAAPTEAH